MEVYLICGSYEDSCDVVEHKNLYVGFKEEKALKILDTNHRMYGSLGWDYYIETWKDEEFVTTYSARELFGDPPPIHMYPQPTLEFGITHAFRILEEHLEQINLEGLARQFSDISNSLTEITE